MAEVALRQQALEFVARVGAAEDVRRACTCLKPAKAVEHVFVMYHDGIAPLRSHLVPRAAVPTTLRMRTQHSTLKELARITAASAGILMQSVKSA